MRCMDCSRCTTNSDARRCGVTRRYCTHAWRHGANAVLSYTETTCNIHEQVYNSVAVNFHPVETFRGYRSGIYRSFRCIYTHIYICIYIIHRPRPRCWMYGDNTHTHACVCVCGRSVRVNVCEYKYIIVMRVIVGRHRGGRPTGRGGWRGRYSEGPAAVDSPPNALVV